MGNIGGAVVEKQVSVPKAMEAFNPLSDAWKKEIQEEVAAVLKGS